MLVGTVGEDFDEYRQWLDEHGRRHLGDQGDRRTSTRRRASSTPTSQDNQITAFYPGAMAQAATVSLHDLGVTPDDLVIIAPNDPTAMARYAAECTAAGIPYLYDPSMQLPRMDKAELEAGCKGAKILAGNDYEFGMMAEKMGIAEADLRRRTPDHRDDPGRGRGPDHRRRPGIRDPPGQAREGRRPHRRGRRVPRRLRRWG